MRKLLSRVSIGSIRDSFVGKELKPVLQRTEFYTTVVDSQGLSKSRFDTESVTSCLQAEIVNALSSGKQDKASTFLSILSQRSDPLTSNDFVHILRYCASSPDALFSMETWRIMQEKEIDVNRRCLKLIVQALTRGGYLEEAFSCLSFLAKSLDTVPDLPMYNVFLHGCARMQSMVHVDSCLDLMEKQMVGRSESTYVALLKFSVLQQNLSAAQEVWKQLIKYYSPKIGSLQQIIKCFTTLGDQVFASELLQHAVDLVCRGETFFRRSVTGTSRSLRLDIPIPSNNDFAFKRYPVSASVGGITREVDDNLRGARNEVMFDLDKCANESFVEAGLGSSALFPLANQGSGFGVSSRELNEGISDVQNRAIASVSAMEILRLSFNNVMHGYARSRNCKLVEQLFLQMQKLGLQPSSHTYECLIRAVVYEKGVIEGLKRFQDMEKENLKPTGYTLGFLSVLCCHIFEIDLAEALLDKPESPLWILPYNELLTAYKITDQLERALRLLKKMKRLEVKFDIRTYTRLFSLFGNVNVPYQKGTRSSKQVASTRIKALEADMVKNGVQHNHISIASLLTAIGAEGMEVDLFHYLDKLTDGITCKPLQATIVYNALLGSLFQFKKVRMMIRVFKRMKSHGLPTDYTTYCIMLKCCSLFHCSKSAHAYVSMMLRDGYKLRLDGYKALIETLMANQDFDEAVDLLYQLCSEGMQPNVALFNSMLCKALAKRQIVRTERIIAEMLHRNFQPDPMTVSVVFHSYVHQHRHRSHAYSTAMEALQVLSMRMISNDDETLQEKSKYFEDNFIYAEDEEVESRIVKIFEEYGEYVATALLNLRWCAILGSSISWSPNQSEWTKQISAQWSPRGSTSSCGHMKSPSRNKKFRRHMLLLRRKRRLNALLRRASLRRLQTSKPV